MGVVSPVGNDIETFCKNIMNGVCGIDLITTFDTSDLTAKVAAQVKDFDPAADGLEIPFVRRDDKFAV